MYPNYLSEFSPGDSDDNQEVADYSHHGDKTVEPEKYHLNFSDEDEFLVYVALSETTVASLSQGCCIVHY